MKLNKRPNVIVCLCDQLRSFEVGCYGNEVLKTPHIDSLAANGVRFDIAVSNNPVCSQGSPTPKAYGTPARSCLLTGQYSRTCAGYLGNEGDEAPPLTSCRRSPLLIRNEMENQEGMNATNS